MNTAGAVVLALVLLLLAAAVGWVIFTRIRASQLGLPPPPLKSYIPFANRPPTPYTGPSPGGGGGGGGITGWFRAKFPRGGRNARTAAGAYEGPSPSGPGSYSAGYAGAGSRGGGGGGGAGFRQEEEDDDPWDSRVGGYNPYDEERELGMVPPGGGGGGGQHGGGEGYAMNLAVAPGAGTSGGEEERRGRPRSRSPGPGSSAAGAGAGAAVLRADPFGDGAEPSNLSLRGVSPRPMGDGASFAARKAARREDDRRSMFREEV